MDSADITSDREHRALVAATSLIGEADRIAFLTGAGISTSAGIPDFRGPQGVWTLDPAAEAASTLSRYLGESEVRRAAWQLRQAEGLWGAEPTPAHRAIAAAEKAGRVTGIITQNTDGLHQVAGNSDGLVHEVHGNARITRCERCGAEQETWDVITRVRAGDLDPHCRETIEDHDCGGILRATTILFEEPLRPEVMDAAATAVEDADVLVTVGTLLSVFPVAGLVPFAIANGKPVVILNRDETQYDDFVQAAVHRDVQEVVPALLGLG
ncbi:Sir2 family NAD-dependent protein deacetylase [Aestuariimicrobium sp. p3-SID1156]|uniref:SIR2 family NAD-dependent protein deacylase n=1 Tax=Aestuariimicrobium sp. p3-SID1156 TaxID=2916038 RepID=UPI00223B4147|nr:Sir2 family NAD-dependent protein deacetylase [Aestuariimicrobium sp. p3-SID1156]MCT1457953.1 Sir2 family NAD-dependent protein deacetylase [Aestuariimicrobium sp. p3-SID1156]